MQKKIAILTITLGVLAVLQAAQKSNSENILVKAIHEERLKSIKDAELKYQKDISPFIARYSKTRNATIAAANKRAKLRLEAAKRKAKERGDDLAVATIENTLLELEAEIQSKTPQDKANELPIGNNDDFNPVGTWARYHQRGHIDRYFDIFPNHKARMRRTDNDDCSDIIWEIRTVPTLVLIFDSSHENLHEILSPTEMRRTGVKENKERQLLKKIK